MEVIKDVLYLGDGERFQKIKMTKTRKGKFDKIISIGNFEDIGDHQLIVDIPGFILDSVGWLI